MATTSPVLLADEIVTPPSEGQWTLVLRRLRRHRLAMVSLGLLLIIFAASLLAPLIAPFPYAQTNLVGGQFLPPLSANPQSGRIHLLGTDQLGRDMFSRLLFAARISLLTALLVVTISSAIGVVLGLLAGYYRGWVDTVISRAIEFVATFPGLTILLIVSSILLRNENLIILPSWLTALMSALFSVPAIETRQVLLVILTLSLLGWTGTARLTRGVVFSLREQAYLESARALGASNSYAIWRHVLPNALPPLIVDYTLGINGALVGEAALSFLGFGIQDPPPTWGNVLAFARTAMFNYPWLPVVAALPILICSLAINYVGDGLRDALDPRARR